MKKTATLLAVALLAGCNTVPLTNTTFPKGVLICAKETVEVSTGRNPRDMECQCVEKKFLKENSDE